MSEDRSSNEPSDKSWIEKIAHAFSSEPKTREDLFELLAVAKQNEVIDDDAISLLKEYNWTGNIRELRNVVERLVILSGKNITAEDIRSYVLPK